MNTGLNGVLLILILSITGWYIEELKRRLDFLADIWKEFTWKMFAQVLPGIIAIHFLIETIETRFPLMRLSWTRLFFNRSFGNKTFWLAEALHPWRDPILGEALPMMICVSTLLFLPLFSLIQEDAFRFKRTSPQEVVSSSLLFGFLYALLGASLAMAVGMSFVGLFYAYQYRKELNRARAEAVEKFGRPLLNLELECHEEALLVSTAYHTMWNSLVVFYIFVRYNFF